MVHWHYTYDLASTCGTASKDLMWPPNLALVVGEMTSYEIVDRKLNSLFRRNTNKLW